MQVVRIVRETVWDVQHTDSQSVQKHDDGTYDYEGDSFGSQFCQAEDVMILPDDMEINVGEEINPEWYAYEAPLDQFIVQTLAEAQADAIGLVMRSSIADGLITDDEILRVSPALETRHWRAGIHVEVGDVYAYDGALWCCVQQHTTQTNWTPDAVAALWRKIESGDGARVWTTSMDYAVDDIVHYPDLSGPMYRCITAHTSQHGWEPPNVPALWAAYQE